MNTIIKALGALAIAGTVAAGGSAFTAGGVTNPSNAMSGFIGGTVHQASTGAVLSSVDYDVDSTGGTGQDVVTGITLTFGSSIEGRVVTAVLSDTTPGADNRDVTCDTAVVTPWLTATCDVNPGFSDLQSLAVSVAGH
jgi:hypothetical protein